MKARWIVAISIGISGAATSAQAPTPDPTVTDRVQDHVDMTRFKADVILSDEKRNQQRKARKCKEKRERERQQADPR
jgi:hypothetical protein